MRLKRGFIGDLDRVFASGLALQESKIIDIVFPEQKIVLLQLILLKFSNNKEQYKSIIEVGCDGHLGLAETFNEISRTAIERATVRAKLTIGRVEVKGPKTVFYG